MNDQPLKGIHYSECEETTDGIGNFSFNLGYNPNDINCLTNGFFEIYLFIAKENEALSLTSGSSHQIIIGINNPYRLSTTEIKLFDRIIFLGQYSSISIPQILSISPITDDDLIIELPFDEGAIFRYIGLSRDYLKEALNNQELEFTGNRSLLQAPVRLEWASIQPANNFGGFGGCDGINVRRYYDALNIPQRNYANIVVCSHEYGHYFDCNIARRWRSGQNVALTEGFALFFSYAVKVWVYNSYSDYLFIDDDCEIGPFCSLHGNNIVINVVNGNPNNLLPLNRFGNMSQRSRTNSINNNRFACYLWNIYDSFNDAPFSPLACWSNKGNEDVNGLRQTLYNFWISSDISSSNYTSVQLFNSAFQNSLQDEQLRTSIQAIYDFMCFNFNNFNLNEPINEINVRMNSIDIPNKTIELS